MGKDWRRTLRLRSDSTSSKGVPVKRSALVLAAAFAVAACQDGSTAPEARDLSSVQNRFSNPPPPPIEGTATLSIGVSTSFAATSMDISPALSEACETALPIFIQVPVKYFFNRVQNSGFVHFSDSDADGVDVSANGMVREQDGRESGQGTITINEGGCEIVVNLASVQNVVFGDCSGPIVIDGAETALAPEDNPEQACFYAEFDEVTADGEPVPGGATLFGNLGDNEEEITSTTE